METARFNKNLFVLPLGSLFTYIEKDWFERFKPLLVVNEYGQYVPRRKTLPELEVLLAAYHDYEIKKPASERYKKLEEERLDSLIKTMD